MRKKTRFFWVKLTVLTVGFAFYMLGTGVAGAAEISTFNKAPKGYSPAGVSSSLVEILPPDGAISEGEPNCYDDYVDVTNGGCNSDPPVFGSVMCGDVIRGTAGNYVCNGGACGDPGNYRDTDWFRVEVNRPGTITMTGMAEFPVQFLIVDGNTDCSAPVVLNFAHGDAGVQTSVSAEVEPGIYYLWAGTQDFVGVSCGSDYFFTYICNLMPIPTLSFWGLLVVAFATAASSLWMIRRRKRKA